MENIEKYKSSNPLQKQFIRNVDKSGLHIFTQIKRIGNICLYKRTRMNGDLIGYELFKTKIVKAKSNLPGGWNIKNDYEKYPVANDFGFSAKFIGGINAEARAEEMFQNWVNNPKIKMANLK